MSDTVSIRGRVQASVKANNSCFLPQAFPRGSPTPPEHPAGPGAVAGACITRPSCRECELGRGLGAGGPQPGDPGVAPLAGCLEEGRLAGKTHESVKRNPSVYQAIVVALLKTLGWP